VAGLPPFAQLPEEFSRPREVDDDSLTRDLADYDRGVRSRRCRRAGGRVMARHGLCDNDHR